MLKQHKVSCCFAPGMYCTCVLFVTLGSYKKPCTNLSHICQECASRLQPIPPFDTLTYAWFASEDHGVSMLIGCHIMQGIKERDGHDCNVDDLYLTEGASGAVKNILQIMIRDENDAILIPYPQYPLYSAAIALLGGTVVPYYPDENKGWQIDPAHLEDVLAQVLSPVLASCFEMERTCRLFRGPQPWRGEGRGEQVALISSSTVNAA